MGEFDDMLEVLLTLSINSLQRSKLEAVLDTNHSLETSLQSLVSL